MSEDLGKSDKALSGRRTSRVRRTRLSRLRRSSLALKKRRLSLKGSNISADLDNFSTGSSSSDVDDFRAGSSSSDLDAYSPETVPADLELLGSGSTSSDLDAYSPETVPADLELLGSGSTSSDLADYSGESEVYISDFNPTDSASSGGSDEEECSAPLSSPLYTDAPISTEACWYVIYRHLIDSRTSCENSKKILKILKVCCPSDNSCPQSLHLLRKHFEKQRIAVHHHCTNCMVQLEKGQKKCRKPSCTRAQVGYYSLLPFQSKLRDIFEGKWEQMLYPFKRTAVANSIQDIQDGRQYQALSSHGGFLSVPKHTGLVLCTDGIQLFKSCNQSLWPIMLAVTSLPPAIRMNAENLILAAVWQGPVKPSMDIFLKPVLEQIKNIHKTGLVAKTPVGPKRVKACLLTAVFDLPAKAMVTNMIQFNGNYGCTYCLDKGIHVDHVHVYPPEAEHNPRTLANTNEYALQAEALGKVVYGVKGKSILSEHFSITEAVPVDYMHAVLEGVVKTLMNIWLNSKYHSSNFYLGRHTADIDELLVQIKPPTEFRRTPRSITTYKHWKASEFRAFLLYYALPILSKLLSPNYVHHLSLLVSAMHLLLGKAISDANVDLAENLLNRFYSHFPELYPVRHCTANIHSLIHLSECVRNWGPLWCYSCFGFENMNGFLRKHCHGTKNVLPQLIHQVHMRTILPRMCKKFESSENAATIELVRMLNPASACEDGIIGDVKRVSVRQWVISTLLRAKFLHMPVDSLLSFPRFRLNSVVYQPQRDCLRDDSICAFEHSSSMNFGCIRKFVCIGSSSYAIVSVFEQSPGMFSEYIGDSSIAFGDLALAINSHVFKVKKSTLDTVAVPMSQIRWKCVLIPLKGCNFNLILRIANFFEHH